MAPEAMVLGTLHWHHQWLAAYCIGLMTPRQKIVTGTVELLTGAVLQYFRALGNDLIANC